MVKILFNQNSSFEVSPLQLKGKLETEISINPEPDRIFFTFLLQEKKEGLKAIYLFDKLNGSISLEDIDFSKMTITIDVDSRYRIFIMESSIDDSQKSFMMSNCFSFLKGNENETEKKKKMGCSNFTSVETPTQVVIPQNLSDTTSIITIPIDFKANENFLCNGSKNQVNDQNVDKNDIAKYVHVSSTLINELEVKLNDKEEKEKEKGKFLTSLFIGYDKLTKENEKLKKALEDVLGIVSDVCSECKKRKIEDK